MRSWASMGAEAPALMESVGPREPRVSFPGGDSWCRAITLELSGGVRLGITAC
jgi:hypothetical protein